MMTNQEDAATSFTLSFAGVEFCLSPNSIDAIAATENDNVMSITKICKDEVLLNLNNFSGSFHVKKKGHGVYNDADEATALQTASESVLSKHDNNGDDHDIIIDAAPAAAADDTLTPTPVEDTPSPKAQEEKKEKLLAEKPNQQKGQQKLNFFGKGDKQKQGGKGKKKSEQNTQKSSAVAASTKRSSSSAGDESAGGRKKKSRATKTSNNNNSTLELCIEEPNDNDLNNNSNFKFTMQSLGQSMLSQEDSRDSCDVSLGGGTGTAAESNLKEDRKSSITTSIISKKSSSTIVPCPRWGQTMTMIDHRRFIVYGGQTIDQDEAKPLADLFVYDLLDNTWTQPMNCDGVARTWHSANFLPDRQLLLCFGGEKLNDSGKLVTTDEVMVLDTEIMLWYPPQVDGAKPGVRGGHASCVLSDTNELICFGGVKNGKWLNSVSILDTNRWRWSTLKPIGDAPRPRSYHSATSIASPSSDVGNRVLIFGGNDGDKSFNGVHVLEQPSEGKKWIWSNPKCLGDEPEPRTGHTATLLNDGYTIMIYGGWDPNTEDENGDDLIFGDSYLLDTKSWTWSKGPKPRYEKSKNNTANGGANRVGHSSVLAPGGKNGVQVLAFAGRVPENKFAGDFQSLIVPL